VLNTHQMIYTYLINLKPFIIEVLQDAAKGATDAAREFKDKIDGQIVHWRDTLMAAGGQAEMHSTGTAPPGNLKGNYVADMTRSGVLRAAGNSGASAQPDTDSDKELAELGAKLGTDWLAAIGDTWTDLPSQILSAPIGSVRSVQAILLDGVEILLNTMKALADAFTDCVIDLIAALRQELERLVTLIFSVIDEPVEIPFVSAFYENVIMRGNGQKLSLLSLGCLMAAAPITFVYKLTHDNKAPFSAKDVETFKAMPPSDYTWLVNPLRPRPTGTGAGTASALGFNPEFLLYSVNTVGSFIFGLASFINDADFFIVMPAGTALQKASSQLKYGYGYLNEGSTVSKILRGLMILGNLTIMAGGVVLFATAPNLLAQASVMICTIGLALGMASYITAIFLQAWCLADTVVGLAAAILAGIGVLTAVVAELGMPEGQWIPMALIGIFQMCGGLSAFPKLAMITGVGSTVINGAVMLGLDGLGWGAAMVTSLVKVALTDNPLKRPAYDYCSRYCAQLDMA
jgi:hypothetical protein